MGKIIKISLFLLIAGFFIFSGCGDKDTGTGPTAPSDTNTPEETVTEEFTATSTYTVVPTSTPALSYNIEGTLTLPESAGGRQFKVIVDTDLDPENGYTGSINEICGSSTQINYQMNVPDGVYYVYAFVDVNDSGLENWDGNDYAGYYGSSYPDEPSTENVTTPMTGVDITLVEVPPTVTIHITLPDQAPGMMYMAGLFLGIGPGNDPAAGVDGALGFSTDFYIKLTNVAKGDYYCLGMVDTNGNMEQIENIDEGDFFGIYGGDQNNFPASPNVTVDGDLYIELPLQETVPNVFGDLMLPDPAYGSLYQILVSEDPIGESTAFQAMKLAPVTSTTVTQPYAVYVPMPGNYYITALVDINGSGLTEGPLPGDYAGIYGVPTPIANWEDPWPASPNASCPGNGFDIYLDTMPGEPTSTATVTLTATNTPEGPTHTYTATPTATATPDYGTVSGNLLLPDDQWNKPYSIIVDTDLNPLNGNVNEQEGTCGLGTSVPYSVTAPAGAYYVYAVVFNSTSLTGNITAGDYLGVYGAQWPDFPVSTNVIVENNTVFSADIDMETAYNNVSGTIVIPDPAPGADYAVLVDDDTDGGNGSVGAVVSAVPDSSLEIPYELVCPFPGSFYLYALVDATGDGLFNGPGDGDYMGFYGSPSMTTIDPAVMNGPYEIITDVMGATATPTPEFTPVPTSTPDPDPILSGEITLEIDAEGNYFWVGVHAGDFQFDYQYTGICEAGLTQTYGLDVPDGDWNIVCVVYMDGETTEGSPKNGDQIGLHGALYPAWPSGTTVTISGGTPVTADITVVQVFDNVSGTITMPEAQPGNEYAVFLDSDAFEADGGEMAYTTGICGLNNKIEYSFLAAAPGDYYVYAVVDNTGDGIGNDLYPPDGTAVDSGDYLGFYGGSEINPPASPLTIDNAQTYVLDFDVAEHP
ncbi:MAG: hypothetical protein ACLFP1_05930 [Candidatus Goldiibacteriota bacterium]